MDVFKQRKNLIITIVFLVLLNLTTLIFLWIGKPKRDDLPRPRERVEKLLKDDLNFTDEQVNKFIELRQNHRENVGKLNREIMQLKKEMFDQVLINDYNVGLADSLLNISLEKQRKIEELTLQHFLGLKEICNKDQEKRLMKVMHRILPFLNSTPTGFTSIPL